jgi:hypothetical protein
VRVKVTLADAPGEGWQVTLEAGGAVLAEPVMAAVPEPPGVGPAGESMPSDDAPHYALTQPGGVAEREQLVDRLARFAPEDDDVERMGRYLFDSLIGSTAWDKVKQKAKAKGETAIELALAWGKEHRALDRLHWELMHDHTAFLAGHPELTVAVTRIVEGATAPEPDPVAAPVDVLFVIGSHLADPGIRAGAEIMGLLRRAESGEGAINAHVSEWTTLSSLQARVRRRRPKIVHFITHGQVRKGAGWVLLRREGSKPGDRGADEFVDAKALLTALGDEQGALPPLVVVTACETGTTGIGEHTAPLAADLVAGGIPAVIGMTGRVSDMACRLFTARFGTVITCGKPLIKAVSAGRRAALLGNGGAGEGMDWALPALFLAPSVTPGFAPVDATAASVTLKRLERYDLDVEPVFCGRREHLRAFEQLLDPDDPLRVLAAYTEEPIAGVGKGRLLHEFARRALREGHAVLFLRKGAGADTPTSPGKLGAQLLRELQKTRMWLDLPFPPSSALLTEMKDAAKSGPDLAALPEANHALELTRFARNFAADLDLEMLGLALAAELAQLAADVRAAGGPKAPGAGAVVLLEAIDGWGIEKEGLFAMLASLSDAGQIPVALTCSLKGLGGEDLADIRKEALKGRAVRFVQLAPFEGDDEDLAYRWVLLNPRPDVFPPDSKRVYTVREKSTEWLERYRQHVRGMPGTIDSPIFYALTAGMATGERPPLIPGDDDDVLQGYLQGDSG